MGFFLFFLSGIIEKEFMLYQLFCWINFSLPLCLLPETAGVNTVTEELLSSQFSVVQLLSHVYSVKMAHFS